MQLRTHSPRQFLGRLSGAESGQALTELGLVMPVLVLMLIGAVELARVAYVAIEVSNAAHAGAQYGAQSIFYATDTTGIQNAAANDAANITLASTTPTLTYTCSDGTTPSGSPLTCASPNATVEGMLTVVTTASFNPFFHVAGLGTTFTLTGRDQQTVLLQ
ncbi:MAG: TadE family protein [Terracidiphilus sp.]